MIIIRKRKTYTDVPDSVFEELKNVDPVQSSEEFNQSASSALNSLKTNKK